VAKVAAMAAAVEAVIPEAFAGNGHAFLMAIYKDPKQDIRMRLEAAKAAARYETPTLEPIKAQGAEASGELTVAQRLAAIIRVSNEDRARKSEIESSESKVVDLNPTGQRR